MFASASPKLIRSASRFTKKKASERTGAPIISGFVRQLQ
jgi:hypothetical protein